MPERPAPTTRTSRCSMVALPVLRGCAGELVVEGAVLAEQRGAPLLDQRVGVAVVGMEAGLVVLLELVPDLDAQERRLAQVPQALEDAASAPGVAVEQHAEGGLHHH